MKFFLPLLLLLSSALQAKLLKPAELHPQIGNVISASLNERLNLLEEPGTLINARFYKIEKEQKYAMHLYFKDSLNTYLSIVPLSSSEIDELKQEIRLRLKSGRRDGWQPLIKVKTQQAKTPFYSFQLSDGSNLMAKIVRVKNDSVSLLLKSGSQLQVADAQILEARPILQSGGIPRGDPIRHRLFLAPTALGLKAGQSEISDYYIFFPHFSIGLSSNLMLGAGISLLPGADEQLVYFSGKASFQISPVIHVAAGYFGIGLPDASDFFNMSYLTCTAGNENFSSTFGLLFSFPTSDNFKLFFVGFEKQLGSHLKIISENWIGPDDLFVQSFFSLGMRYFTRRLAVNFAFFTNSDLLQDETGLPAIPYLDFTIFLSQ